MVQLAFYTFRCVYPFIDWFPILSHPFIGVSTFMETPAPTCLDFPTISSPRPPAAGAASAAAPRPAAPGGPGRDSAAATGQEEKVEK